MPSNYIRADGSMIPALTRICNVVNEDERIIPKGTATSETKPLTPVKAIRAKCLDCCGGDKPEVRDCAAINCPLHPYRMGRNPNRAGIGRRRDTCN
jgi:hypothetical protein